LIGNVSYEGVGISQCVSSDHIALTFDDGPYNFTWHLLDVLASYNAKATFFVTGNNLGKGQMDVEETGYPALIRRMHADGHQIASHTWTHQNLTEMSEEHMINQMHYNEMAFRNILGFFPTYMRPPYSECNSTCQAIMKKMGYHITLYTLVTHGSSVLASLALVLCSYLRISTYFFAPNQTIYMMIRR
jgi:peptidoglycan/xylan/chitin deacetylase (PgdA/CDA1 family)